MMSQAASPPDFPVPPLRAGNYSAEIVAGPRGPVAVYRFAFAGRGGRRLLVLKLDHYGDFLIGLPALQRLREAFPADHITLVCGSWNVALARRLGIADEVRGYDFFPENGAFWNGQAFEGLPRFREVCRGEYDLALDLRVDEDTRFLLEHVEAATRCGIGLRARYLLLAQGRFRAHFGLRLLTALPRLSRAKIVIDATRNAGSATVATERLAWA